MSVLVVTGPRDVSAGGRYGWAISVSGDQVSFTPRSVNPGGTVQAYRGTDTVAGGKIVAASVTPTSGPGPA